MPASEARTLSINDLVLIPELSPRTGLCEETVIRYMDSFGSLPPVRVQAGTNVVVDGYHRVEAAVRLGLEEIPVAEESIADEELRLTAGVANVAHGQPLTRPERNRLAVAMVSTYGKPREEAARLLGMSPGAVTLALREHQFNDLLSEKLGSPVQVINSAHVRALYRVGPEQRERLLEAVVTKVDSDGQPYPLTGAELKSLVDRMLDPATPSAELGRLLSDPHARPKTNGTGGGNGHPLERPASGYPLVAAPCPDALLMRSESGEGPRPWEQEWESPLKGGDSDAFDRARGVDEQISGGRGPARQATSLLRRAGENPVSDAGDRWDDSDDTAVSDHHLPFGQVTGLRSGLAEATRALEQLVPRVHPGTVRREVERVIELLRGLLTPPPATRVPASPSNFDGEG